METKQAKPNYLKMLLKFLPENASVGYEFTGKSQAGTESPTLRELVLNIGITFQKQAFTKQFTFYIP